MNVYHYALTAFPSDMCNLGNLQREVKAATLPDCCGASVVGSGIDICFEAELTGAEETTLDGVVATSDTAASLTPTFLASSKLVENEVAITTTTTWQDLGGVRTSVGFFVKDMTQAVGQIVGDSKVDGTGAKLRMVKSDADTPISAEIAIADSAGAWVELGFQTNAEPDAASQTYRLQGKLDGAASASVRFVSMSLLQVS